MNKNTYMRANGNLVLVTNGKPGDQDKFRKTMISQMGDCAKRAIDLTEAGYRTGVTVPTVVDLTGPIIPGPTAELISDLHLPPKPTILPVRRKKKTKRVTKVPKKPKSGARGKPTSTPNTDWIEPLWKWADRELAFLDELDEQELAYVADVAGTRWRSRT